MPTPQITITPAGFAAIVNAENTGTAPVKITQVGLTGQHFDVATVGAAVPNETKRLTTFGGRAIADDTLHLNVRDDGQDTYTLRGFGLYLEDGTLFAVYSQATPIMEKAAAATLLLATDIRFTNITATSIEVGDVDFINPPASTTQLGVVRLATEQEADGGADHTKAITPRGLAGYINRRFGAGAPSEFVKGLLGAATAAIFRVELGLKSAATRDEGHGNGLNADLLDGEHGAYYLDWRNFSNLPTNFNPGTHSHPISGVEGLQEALNGKQPVGSYAHSSHTHGAYVEKSGSEMTGSLNFRGAGTAKNRVRVFHNADENVDYGAKFLLDSSASTTTLGEISIIPVGASGYLSEIRFSLKSGDYYNAPTSVILKIATSGIEVFGSIKPTGGYDYGSSRRLKIIEGECPYGLAEVRRVSTVIGHYRPEYEGDGRRRVFFEAEQMAEVMPELVDLQAVRFGDEMVPGIKLEQVMPPAYRAIAQLADIVDGLAKHISDLRTEVESLRRGQVG